MELQDETIVELLFEVNRLNRRHSELVYGRLNPFRGQYRCLFVLSDVGEINQKALSALLSVRPASVSELLLKLEQKQLIRRTTSTEDNRVSLVSLTEQGREEVLKIRKARAKAHREMLAELTPEEKTAFFAALQKIKQHYTAEERSETYE